MPHRLLPLFLTVLLATSLPACSKKKTAAQMTAEKQQTLRAEKRKKAIQYYNEIVTKFPDSEYAAQAKARLEVLGPASPAKK